MCNARRERERTIMDLSGSGPRHCCVRVLFLFVGPGLERVHVWKHTNSDRCRNGFYVSSAASTSTQRAYEENRTACTRTLAIELRMHLFQVSEVEVKLTETGSPLTTSDMMLLFCELGKKGGGHNTYQCKRTGHLEQV